MPSVGNTAARQPQCASTAAASGRNASCPVAVLAPRMPSTSPRRSSNQRVATIAPITIAVSPVPTPTTTPQSNTRCHSRVMNSAPINPTPIMAIAVRMTRFIP